MMKRTILAAAMILLAVTSMNAQSQTREIPVTPELQILPEDIVVNTIFSPAYGEEAKKLKRLGVQIIIRKKPGIESIMLCETTKDPSGKEPNYAYRAPEGFGSNEEIRYLNGKKLDSKYARNSLISSTPKTVHTKDHGTYEAFVINVPETIEYGYPWSRHGTVRIGKGTFINIRTFEKKYGDYTGKFMDNPFMFDFGKPVRLNVETPQVPEPPVEEIAEEPEEIPEVEEVIEETAEVELVEEVTLTDKFNPVAAQEFGDIAKENGGLMIYSKGPEYLCQDLLSSVQKTAEKGMADVVFALDTTGSMKDDMEALKTNWIPMMLQQLDEFPDLRIGLLFYRDYNDSFNYKGLPVKVFEFTRSAEQFKKWLDSIVIKGLEGGDVPEAVYEALFSAMSFYEWREGAEKKVILIGDAEPHPRPRGSRRIDRKKISALAKEKDISIDCIILPDEKK